MGYVLVDDIFDEMSQNISYIKLEKKLAKNTIESYKFDLDSYQKFLRKNKIYNPQDIKLTDINTYFYKNQYH